MTKLERLELKKKYDFFYMKNKFTHCKRLEESPRNCLTCPCEICFATQPCTAGEREMLEKVDKYIDMLACNKGV